MRRQEFGINLLECLWIRGIELSFLNEQHFRGFPNLTRFSIQKKELLLSSVEIWYTTNFVLLHNWIGWIRKLLCLIFKVGLTILAKTLAPSSSILRMIIGFCVNYFHKAIELSQWFTMIGKRRLACQFLSMSEEICGVHVRWAMKCSQFLRPWFVVWKNGAIRSYCFRGQFASIKSRIRMWRVARLCSFGVLLAQDWTSAWSQKFQDRYPNVVLTGRSLWLARHLQKLSV